MPGIKPVPTWAPGDEMAVVVPDDNNDLVATLAVPAQGVKLYVGTAGNVTVDGAVSGVNVTFQNVPAGSILPILVKRVHNTGTTVTAGSLIAIW